MPNTAKQMTRSEWLEMRKQGVGASEVAAVVGENPYQSAYELWALKTGRLDDQFEDDERQEWGRALEPIIAQKAGERLGLLSIKDEGEFATVQHPSCSRLFATVDRRCTAKDRKGPGSMEVKNTHWRFEPEWQTGGPVMYQLQLQTQLEVNGWSWGVLAGLVGGNAMTAIPMDRDKELGGIIVEQVEKFWELVKTDTAPPTDGSESCRRVLHKIHPRDDLSTIKLDAQFKAMADRMARLKSEIAWREGELEEHSNIIRDTLGKATWGEIPGGGRFQWKWQETKHKAREAFETSTRVLRKVK